MNKKNRFIVNPVSSGLLLAAAIGTLPALAQAASLAHESFTITGLSSSTSDMIMSDGTSWSGGAVGLQGSASFNPSSKPLAANVSFKYNIGSVIDSLNATYGAGNWSIANPELTFQYTLYANNTRFGGGAGTFDVYWVGNDNWVQGSNNPVYATTAAGLAGWSGSQADLGSQNFTWSTPSATGSTSTPVGSWTTDKTGPNQATISYALGLASNFVGDVTSATASSNAFVSLYLMATSPNLGATIFTGGGTSLPTLSFDVVSAPAPVPIPAALLMCTSALGMSGIVAWRRGRKGKF